jgi:hypothetical protein
MSKKRQQQRLRWIGIGLVVAGAALVFVVGGLVYALLHASVVALRWWAGLATVALPIGGALAFYLGRVEARGRMVGLEQGVSAVMRAAHETADLRAAQVREARRPVEALQSINPQDVVIVEAPLPQLKAGRGDIVEL